jgi:hypothetical protein
MDYWPHLLAYITGRVDQELLLRNEYLAAENRIPRGKNQGSAATVRWREIHSGRDCPRLGRKALTEVAVVASPDTILASFAPTGEEETEARQTGLRRPGENLTNCHREATVIAPLLDSTQPT